MLEAAVAAFVASCVNVPVRDMAAQVGVGIGTLYRHFPKRADLVVPVCVQLLDAAVATGEIRPDIETCELFRGVGNLCVGAGDNQRYDARRMVELVIAGLRLQDD